MRKITTLLLLSAPFMAFSQWTNDPTVNTNVVDPVKKIYEWSFGVNPDNTISTAFLAPVGETTEMWYNIHDTEGKSIFADGAKLADSRQTMTWNAYGSIAYHDSKGNMLLIYQNLSNAQQAGLTTDQLNYNIYKVSPTGEMLWEESLDLNRGEYSDAMQCAATVAELEDGSYIIAYCDYRRMQSGYDKGRICLERISADGELLWDEPKYIEDTTIDYTYPYLVSAGDNQVILLFAKGTNQDLVARKIDFEGSSVWNEDVIVYRGGFVSIPLWTFLSVMSDGEGGMFVGWYDDRYFTNYEKSYVSHILSDGSYGYASGIEGEALGYTDTNGLRCFAPTMLWDKENKYLYTIRRETSSSQGYQRLMIQKMSESGELLWGSEGVEMHPDNGNALAYFDLQFAEDGNVVAFYMEQLSGNTVAGYAHKFNAETGEAMWDEDILFTPTENMCSSLKASRLIDGKYWVVMWEDSRKLEGDSEASMERKHLYMQRINIDGTLGEPTSVETLGDDADIKVVGRNIIAPQGSEVYALDGLRSNAENLSPGIYIVRCGDKVQKVIIK